MQTNSFSLFLRYQAQAERNYQQAIAKFERLKALRTELAHEENGFVPQNPTEGAEEPLVQQNQPLAHPDPACHPDASERDTHNGRLRDMLEANVTSFDAVRQAGPNDN